MGSEMCIRDRSSTAQLYAIPNAITHTQGEMKTAAAKHRANDRSLILVNLDGTQKSSSMWRNDQVDRATALWLPLEDAVSVASCPTYGSLVLVERSNHCPSTFIHYIERIFTRQIRPRIQSEWRVFRTHGACRGCLTVSASICASRNE